MLERASWPARGDDKDRRRAETVALGPVQGTKARSGSNLYPHWTRIGACVCRGWVWAALPSPRAKEEDVCVYHAFRVHPTAEVGGGILL